jgi:hypothetical protein
MVVTARRYGSGHLSALWLPAPNAIQRLKRSIDMNFCLPSRVRPVITCRDDR